MIFGHNSLLIAVAILLTAAGATTTVRADGSSPAIDRHDVVSRHSVVSTKFNGGSPVQVGNGHFAFGADLTGLQTFTPFATMSDWGWYSEPLPSGQHIEDFHGQEWDTHGRMVAYPITTADQQELGRWLYANPHRINLGRLGLELKKSDGTVVSQSDIKNARQELDLWTGVITSRFEVEGTTCEVRTCCHPTQDDVAVEVSSSLIASGSLSILLSFPGPDTHEFASLVGDWNHPENHHTVQKIRDEHRVDFDRRMNTTSYVSSLSWQGEANLSQTAPHSFRLTPAAADHFEFVCAYSATNLPATLPSANACFKASIEHWKRYWSTGGIIDLSHSHDPRWFELERRIVLSQYLMAVNEAGDLPPQESGLVNNGWNGKFHLEMTWWHSAQWALWNRWQNVDPILTVYQRFLSSSKARAAAEGYKGARWPKCSGPEGRESPHPIHALLIWQQPHPIFFAELDYRAHPTRKTLIKWRDIVFNTADFLASYAFHDIVSGHDILGPPLYVVSENTDPRTTQNPAFELSYWRFGLRVAQEWRRRLGIAPNSEWEQVREQLAPIPEQDGLYILSEGTTDMWTKWNFEHPALTGIYGMLPGDGVDKDTMRRTFEKVASVWNFNRTWGWDFPMLAMCAARLGETGRAVDMLLHPSGGFQFDEHGLATGGPFPYFPSNGALLYATAMMAAGWNGAPPRNAPGFPSDGSWDVRWAGLSPAP